MKLCPVCSHENSDGAVICSSCQSEMDPAVRSQKTVLDEARPVSFEPDSLISDRYKIVRELGRGGMGMVYLVKDTRLRDRLTALKMIHPELVSHEEARQRFMDEVILCLDFLHPHIVRINNLEESDGLLYFTMEYIQGQSLRQMMDERKDKHPPFSLEETVRVTGQILDALAYAHKTTIHRDIKPENILLHGEFPDIQVKVLDFGIAKILSASRFTRTAQSMGTAYYMSPEQMQGAKHIDHRSDLYSVGMILYEMVTGELAAGRFKLPGQLFPSLPECIDRIVDKVLSTNPDERQDRAGQLKSELGDCLSGLTRQQMEEEQTSERVSKDKAQAVERAGHTETNPAVEKSRQAEIQKQAQQDRIAAKKTQQDQQKTTEDPGPSDLYPKKPKKRAGNLNSDSGGEKGKTRQVRFRRKKWMLVLGSILSLVVLLIVLYDQTREPMTRKLFTKKGCGAYTAPGVWKEFDCYNLAAIGKTTSDDPFNPSWRLIGGYWQWGRKGPPSSQWFNTNTKHFAHGPTGSGLGNANSGEISGWDSPAPDGAWSDSRKTANDPCPTGYRVPTKKQWEGVVKNNKQRIVGSWSDSSTNYSSARFFGKKLMLPAAGSRSNLNGATLGRGYYGSYWSSSESGRYVSGDLYFTSGNASMNNYYRRYGRTVRCVAE